MNWPSGYLQILATNSPHPGMVPQIVYGALVTAPTGVSWETVAVVSFTFPVEASTANTVAAMSATGPATPGTPPSLQNTPSLPPVHPGDRAP